MGLANDEPRDAAPRSATDVETVNNIVDFNLCVFGEVGTSRTKTSMEKEDSKAQRR